MAGVNDVRDYIKQLVYNNQLNYDKTKEIFKPGNNRYDTSKVKILGVEKVSTSQNKFNKVVSKIFSTKQVADTMSGTVSNNNLSKSTNFNNFRASNLNNNKSKILSGSLKNTKNSNISYKHEKEDKSNAESRRPSSHTHGSVVSSLNEIKLKSTSEPKIEIEINHTDGSQKGNGGANKSLIHSQSKKSNLRIDLSKKSLVTRRTVNNTTRSDISKDRKVINSLSTSKLTFSGGADVEPGLKTKASMISARSTKSNSTNFLQNNKERMLVTSSSKDGVGFKNTFTSYSTSSSLNKNKEPTLMTQKSLQFTNLARSLKSELKIVKVTSNLTKGKLDSTTNANKSTITGRLK
jgi:hypothetical protein